MTDFLVEIHTEELPPLSLRTLSLSFLENIKLGLQKSELSFDEALSFATPRRLAVLVKEISPQQADHIVEKKGPALTAAFDTSGQPTPACMGFAKSCGVSPADLIELKSDQGTWLGVRQSVKGKTAKEILPLVVQDALKALPINKRMRWGSSPIEFIRPVHSVILLYGRDIIPVEILGIKANHKTRGHRFHSTGWIDVIDAASYAAQLKDHFVIADFNERKEKIRHAIKEVAEKNLPSNAEVMIPDDLLNEVNGLVEWPAALCGQFDKAFLDVPSEALIASMKSHQRYFPVVDKNQQLLPYFIMISNIESKDRNQVIKGNERVLAARLSDAAFFFETDKKKSLKEHSLALADALSQKSRDIAEFITCTASDFSLSASDLEALLHAASIAKADLATTLVCEFPELQGIAGFYYAKQDGESDSIAIAIKEHYLPRFSGDQLPSTKEGDILAIADRMTLIANLFYQQKIPTGDKDPFGLRRAALGLLRILIEKKMPIDLKKLISATQFPDDNIKKTSKPIILTFILSRLKPFYQEQKFSSDVIASVMELNLTVPYDIHCRIRAVNAFKLLPSAMSLCAANKRVAQILAKNAMALSTTIIDTKLFEHTSENVLFEKMEALQERIIPGHYAETLHLLSALREPIDDFFNNVMVMTDDKDCRENRLLLLKKLRTLFLSVADVALLQ